MVDEVEIKNVGGRNGVASEATLAALVASLNSGGVSREKIAKLEALARSANTKKITEESKQRGILGKTFSGLASSAGGLIKEFAVGGNRMGDFAEAVFGAQSSLTGLVRAVDGLIDSYRELTTVGASFNNSMFDFIKASAETGMSLGEYGSFILQNTDKMKNLGGTVTEGAKRFGEISKIMRQNFGSELTRVGMTMSEMNEILVEYTDFSISRMGKETRSNYQLARGAQTYALELDKLSKLTGLSRKQLAEEQRKQLADQRVRVAMTGMDETQQLNLTNGLSFVGSYSQNLAEMLRDMIDNVPDNEDTKYLKTASKTFDRFAGDIENMSIDEIAEFTAAVGREVDAFSKANPFMDQIPGFQNVYSLGAELAALSEMTADERKKRLAEIGKQDAITAALLNFELALNNVKTFILEQILSLGPDFSELANELFDFSGIASETGDTFDKLKEFAKTLISDGFTLLKTEIQQFTAYLKAGGDPVEYLKEGLKNVATAVYDWFKELLFGATKEIETPAGRRTVETQGIFGKMVDAFSEFWKSDTMVSIRNAVTDYFRDLVETIEDMFVNSTTLNALLGIDREEVAYRQATTGANIDVENALTAALGKGFWNTSELGGIESVGGQDVYNDLLAQLGDSADQYWTVNGKIEAALEELGKKYEEGTATESERRLFADAIANLTNPNSTPVPAGVTGYDEFGSIPGNATGTVGFEDFGNESLRKLHGLEAVVPRNTQAGEYLSKYFTDDWRAKAQPVAPMNNSNNQEALTKQLSQLNNTMALVLSELKINNDLNKKTISSVKGLSGDLYRGV